MEHLVRGRERAALGIIKPVLTLPVPVTTVRDGWDRSSTVVSVEMNG